MRRPLGTIALALDQALAEALAVLVAARTWCQRGYRILNVRSDSAVGLAAVCNLKTKSPQILAIVLEASLDLALGRYQVRAADHIPGVSNLEADALSRLTAPDAKAFPLSLVGVPRVSTDDFRLTKFWSLNRRCRRAGIA